MRIDLSVRVKSGEVSEILANENMAQFDHIGTHFDLLDKEFSLENLKQNGVIFDVCKIRGRDIEISDIDKERVGQNDFVIFYTGYLAEKGYGTKPYFQSHPQLSWELIDYLLDKRVSIIGIDAAGIRVGTEHKEADRKCADNNIFVVENLDHLGDLFEAVSGGSFTVYTFPINWSGMSGLPCRVVAEID